jgi:hypothetical protein
MQGIWTHPCAPPARMPSVRSPPSRAEPRHHALSRRRVLTPGQRPLFFLALASSGTGRTSLWCGLRRRRRPSPPASWGRTAVLWGSASNTSGSPRNPWGFFPARAGPHVDLVAADPPDLVRPATLVPPHKHVHAIPRHTGSPWIACDRQIPTRGARSSTPQRAAEDPGGILCTTPHQ